MMGATTEGGVEPPSDLGNGALREEPTFASTSSIGSAGCFQFSAMGPTQKSARVSLSSGYGSDETRVFHNVNDPLILNLDNEGTEFFDAIGGENQPGSSVSTMHGNTKRKSSRSEKLEHIKNRSMVEGYDSILSAFDESTAKGKGESVGHDYKIGDMVWGKVKSHPWWPGLIYNEAFASPSVWRNKHEDQVLVAFFGDSSYGWFNPAELISFEKNFEEKSRQTMSRTFLNAVEEAVDELSRRRSMGLACRCRNKFNFWPANVEGYFVVDVGDYEPGVYGFSQISRARDSFRPREMLSFVHQLALEPMNDQHWTIDFIKNKATILSCRKALFEEFDETYAQAFGTVPVRPPRPTAPVTMDPSKAPLSGRLVIAETLGKGKISVKPSKTKDQMEKGKYLFKRREESIQIKSKKGSSGQAGRSPHPLLVDAGGFSEKVMHSGKRDHMQQASGSAITDSQHQPTSHQAYSNIRSSEGSRRLIEGETKKAKVPKRPAAELVAENAILVEKEKKKKKNNEISNETVGELKMLPVAVSYSVDAVDNVSPMPLSVLLIDNFVTNNQKKDAILGSSSSQSQQEVDFSKVELRMLVTDLRALALNPFHGEERSCPAVIGEIFFKYRSLVYQKSMVSPLLAENEATEGPAATISIGPSDRTSDKIVKPSVRLDDPTKCGKKRGLYDHPEGIKKKKLNVLEEFKRRADDSLNTKKKKTDHPKLLAVEKKSHQRSAESQRGDLKELSAKSVPPTLSKAAKLESSKRMEQGVRKANPTMLVIRFPAGAALPSSAELRAKFARFGPLDHSATRVFWKTYTCRLVFLHKADAQAAIKFTVGSCNLFGDAVVRCHLRELEVEAAESEPVKLQNEDVSIGDSQSRNSANEQRMQKIAGQSLELMQPAKLKSCLKKPSRDEGGNGGGRGARVKFVLGGEESIKGELLFNENKNSNIASFSEGTSSIHSVGINSKILRKFNPELSNSLAPLSTSHFQKQKLPINMASSELGPGKFNAPTQQMQRAPINDISQQMLNLLMRCNDVVNNLRSTLGYLPCHPL